jgi:hypothetical protein
MGHVPPGINFGVEAVRVPIAVAQLTIGENNDSKTETTVRRQDRAFV